MDADVRKIRVEKEWSVEFGRKSFHFALVFFTVLAFRVLGYALVPLIAGLLLLGVALSELCIRGVRVPVAWWGIVRFDRPENVIFRPGMGVFSLLTGIMLTLIMGRALGADPVAVELSILLSAADTFSTLFGILVGSNRWAHNRRKSLEGTAMFLAFAIPITLLYFQKPVFLLVPLVASFFETLPKMDDNFTISISSLLVIRLLLYLGY